MLENVGITKYRKYRKTGIWRLSVSLSETLDAEMHAAVQNDDLEGVCKTIVKGANVNSVDPQFGERALYIAVRREYKDMVRLLLFKGADPNFLSSDNYTPLSLAIRIGNRALDMVDMLLSARADPSIQSNKGMDALAVAAAVGSNVVLQRLLMFGARPRMLSNGMTLMHLAGMGGDAETVLLALEAGANVNDMDRDRFTPLHYAVINDNKKAGVALVKYGAKFSKRNKLGHTPLDYAISIKDSSLLSLLTKQKPRPVVERVVQDAAFKPKFPVQDPEVIRSMTLIEFCQKYYQNARMLRALAVREARDLLPFKSIGDYIDAEKEGRAKLLQVPNIGISTVNELNDAISAVIPHKRPAIAEVLTNDPQSLAKQVEDRYPCIFTYFLNKYANMPLSEIETYKRHKFLMLSILNDEMFAEVASRRFQGETLVRIGESMGVCQDKLDQIESHIQPWLLAIEGVITPCD